MMARPRTQNAADGWSKLTDLAFALCVGVVLARGMMLETIREAFAVVPGQEIVLRSPSAATTVVLDLLTYLPVLLIALRCVFDERWRARRTWSALTLGALGVLALASVVWSTDRYAAAVSAGKLLAGAAVLWAAVQWVRDWGRFRAICGLLAGVLAVNLLYSAIYVYWDMPETRKMWEENRETDLKQRGLDPESFSAKQFEKKILSGEVMAFCFSPNSLAAITVMIVVLLMASIAQRSRDGQGPGWSVVPVLLIVGGIWLIWRAGSKTAAATPAIGLLLLALGWRLRGWLGKHRGLAFSAGVGLFLAMGGAVIAHGMRYETLFQRSLTFRWHYWKASLAMFLDHALAGVGWENFGQYYTQYRLPIAPEEIRDPHNLFVRFATELGIVGLLLAIGWVAALFWEATAPAQREAEAEPSDAVSATWLVTAVVASIAIGCLSALDLTQEGVMVEVLRRIVYGMVMLGTAVAMTTTDFGQVRVRQTPAPILLTGLTAAIAVFFVHNMIDFAIFETGPFYLSVMALGTMIGMRMSLRDATRGQAVVAASGLALAFASTGILAVAPVVLGESRARDADDAVARSRFAQAKAGLQEAFADSAWLHNNDYLLRMATVQAWLREPPAAIAATLDAAVAANSRSVRGLWLRAQSAVDAGDPTRATQSFDRAIALDPQDVGLRIDAGDGFAKLGKRDEAIRQYQAAIELNGHLPEGEPKRLDASKLAQLRMKISALGASAQ